MKAWLTTEILESERQGWEGLRNKDNLRFGQYLFIEYASVPEVVFYWEDPDQSYNYLKGYLRDVQR